VVRRSRADLYVEALAVLSEFSGDLLLPRQVYEACGIEAIIRSRQGDQSGARVLAVRAL
jgi:hypothetical protein